MILAHLNTALVHLGVWASGRCKINLVGWGENIIRVRCFRQIPALIEGVI